MNKVLIFFFLIKFFLLELKNSIFFLINSIKIFKTQNFFNYLNNKLFDGKVKFNDENINKFLDKNKKISKNEKIKINEKNKILVELLLPHHTEPMMMNCLIAKDLQKIYKGQIVGLINKNDLLTKKIAESFGIKDFIYIKKNNFFKNTYFFLKSISLVNIEMIDKNLLNLFKNLVILTTEVPILFHSIFLL